MSALPPPPELLYASSRKIHDAAGPFDINLPLTGSAGIEPRGGDTLTLVMTFDHALASGSASLASGLGEVLDAPTFSGREMTVQIRSVADVQTIVLRLDAVTDVLGGVLARVELPVGILRGDVNSSRGVNTADVNLVRAISGTGFIDLTNFRGDVNLSGEIDDGDVSIVRGDSGHAL